MLAYQRLQTKKPKDLIGECLTLLFKSARWKQCQHGSQGSQCSQNGLEDIKQFFKRVSVIQIFLLSFIKE